MNVRPRGARPPRGDRRRAERTALEVQEAARRLHGLGHDAPTVLLVHPISPLNPFQALLYREAWASGIGPVVLHDLADLDAMPEPTAIGARLVLHLHWTNRVLDRAADAAAAHAAIDATLTRLDAFLAAGGRLVWTIHNVVPHDARLPEAEVTLQRAIVERATVIHVMSPHTVVAAAGAFPLPADRILLVPHPSYAGAYPDLVHRDAARHRLGLDPDAIVYGMLGAIRPYKGLDAVIDAFDRLLADDPPGAPPRHLLVAGLPDRSGASTDFLRRARRHPFITLDARQVPADELIEDLRACDIAVLAHAQALNSGFLMLAITEGLPVVLPDLASFDDLADPAFARRFTTGDAGSLATAWRDADGLLSPRGLAAARAAERAIVEAREPRAISRRFVEGLLAALDRADRDAGTPADPGRPA